MGDLRDSAPHSAPIYLIRRFSLGFREVRSLRRGGRHHRCRPLVLSYVLALPGLADRLVERWTSPRGGSGGGRWRHLHLARPVRFPKAWGQRCWDGNCFCGVGAIAGAAVAAGPVRGPGRPFGTAIQLISGAQPRRSTPSASQGRPAGDTVIGMPASALARALPPGQRVHARRGRFIRRRGCDAATVFRWGPSVPVLAVVIGCA